MNIAITGGAGLIGTELCKIFNQEHNVTVLDFKEPKISGINFIKIDIENKPNQKYHNLLTNTLILVETLTIHQDSVFLIFLLL